MKPRWWCLPGFLGDESHFGPLLEYLEQSQVVSALEFSAASTLPNAASLLAQKALASGERPHLVGYSLGGRLALHAALVAPGAFASVTAISAHPGFATAEARQQRVMEDASWANLLRNDWTNFWMAWNQRGVLAGTPVPGRSRPSDSETAQWVKLLDLWGTGRQEFLPPLLSSVKVPIMTVVGEKDLAHLEYGRLLPTTIKQVVIPGAGHRVPLESPRLLAQHLKCFAQESL